VNFRLEPVLGVRRQRAESVELELADLERQRAAQASTVDRTLEAIAAVGVELRERQRNGRVDLRAVADAQVYAERLERLLADEQARLADLVARVEAKRLELVAAHQDHKAIEKLKEREQLRADTAERAHERRTAEEIATVRFTLRRSGSLALPGAE
jgi:flagellar export protein FliJ